MRGDNSIKQSFLAYAINVLHTFLKKMGENYGKITKKRRFYFK